jgi:ankyrin repeat protein
MTESKTKSTIQLRLDQKIIDFFKSYGKGHITRMQKALGDYAAAHRFGTGSKEQPALIAASLLDDIVAAQQLLAAGTDPDVVDSGGCSALAWAVRYHRTRMALLLLSAGANPNGASVRPGDLTLLMEASAEGRLDLVNALLSAGADPNIQSKRNVRSALMIAADHGHLNVVQALIAAGADCGLRDFEGNTALDIAKLVLKTKAFMFADMKAQYVEIVRLLCVGDNQ